jgi:hypothetical protein
MAGPLHPNGDVVGLVPAVGLPPAGGDQVLEPSGGGLSQRLGARHLHVQALVNDLFVLGHGRQA